MPLHPVTSALAHLELAFGDRLAGLVEHGPGAVVDEIAVLVHRDLTLNLELPTWITLLNDLGAVRDRFFGGLLRRDRFSGRPRKAERFLAITNLGGRRGRNQ